MKIYVINLDRSPERLKQFSDQAAAAGVNFERIVNENASQWP